MTTTKVKRAAYFTQAGRADGDDLLVRTPELQSLRTKTILVAGLGCLGAPSALEFARAGVRQLRLLDRDALDPGTISRWPLGIQQAGRKKIEAIADFIRANYPGTTPRPIDHGIGDVRDDGRLETVLLGPAFEEIDLIYDASAEFGVQHYLSDVAREMSIPYVGVAGTFGGWGGKVVSIVPGKTKGCWYCYQHHIGTTFPHPPSDPIGEIQPRGCGDVTFTGAGFDMQMTALTGVRTAVSLLCGGSLGSYPEFGWDVTLISLRDKSGNPIAPKFEVHTLEKHPSCPICSQI